MTAKNPKKTSVGPGRGGKREGSGRKAEDGATGLIIVAVTMTPEHREKFRKLGGSLWLRKVIDEKFDKDV